VTKGKLVKIPTPVLSSYSSSSFFFFSLSLSLSFFCERRNIFLHVFDSRSGRCIKCALFAATQTTGFNPFIHDKLHEVQVLAGFSCLFNPSSIFQLFLSLSLSLSLFFFSRHVTIERHLVNEVVAYVP